MIYVIVAFVVACLAAWKFADWKTRKRFTESPQVKRIPVLVAHVRRLPTDQRRISRVASNQPMAGLDIIPDPMDDPALRLVAMQLLASNSTEPIVVEHRDLPPTPELTQHIEHITHYPHHIEHSTHFDPAPSFDPSPSVDTTPSFDSGPSDGGFCGGDSGGGFDGGSSGGSDF